MFGNSGLKPLVASIYIIIIIIITIIIAVIIVIYFIYSQYNYYYQHCYFLSLSKVYYLSPGCKYNMSNIFRVSHILPINNSKYEKRGKY